jgi:hypothetical protein
VVKTPPDTASVDASRFVGWECGEWLIGSRVIRSKSRIGIGPGTTVHRVAERVEKAAIPERDLTLVALTGRFDSRVPNKRNVLADADVNAFHFGCGVANDVSYELHNAVALLPSKLDRHASGRRTRWNDDSRLRGRSKAPAPLDFALVGVGILSEDAWFCKALLALSKHGDSIQRDLSALYRLQKEMMLCVPRLTGMPPFTPIGDVACRFFQVRLPEEIEIEGKKKHVFQKRWAEAANVLERVNDRILTISEPLLKRTPLWVVGAGREKAHVLREVVRKYSVDALVTDAACAEAMLTGARSLPPSGATSRAPNADS